MMDSLHKQRVVVTGLGVVSPLGNCVADTWEALCGGRSGIGPITKFNAEKHTCRIAGEIKGFDPGAYIPKKEIKKMDAFIQYALAASIMAVEDARLEVDRLDKDRAGVLVGSGIGGLPTIEHYHEILLEKGPGKVSPFFIPMLIVNLASGQISIRFGFRGPNLSVATACATGNHSLGEALRIIQRGEADVMVAGGAEATISPLGVAGFAAMKALSTRNDEPQKASRPFDLKRDGFVMGEGAGILILEKLEHAKSRGAEIYAELIGYGMSADAYHISSPSPDGSGAAACMRKCIEDAGVSPGEVDYINAHGTSTPAGDRLETTAIKDIFGDHAYRVKISSLKSMIGHLLGASGGVEAVATVLTICNGIITPTINYECPDPECDLDYVPNKAQPANVKVALSNSFGFGGTNSSLIFRKYNE